MGHCAGAGASDDGDDVTIETVYLIPGPRIEERRKTFSRVKKELIVTIVTRKNESVLKALVFVPL